MFERASVLLFYCETPLHMGTGTAVSYVDLPIEREKHTDYPLMPASGIKGVLRDLARREWDKEKVEIIFGPEEKPEEHSSCITFADGRILLLPVRTPKGIFAWVTCPFVLKRLKKDVEIVGLSLNLDVQNLDIPEEKALVCKESILKINGKLLLEDYEFTIEEQADEIASVLFGFVNIFPSQSLRDLLNELPKRLAIISDDAFSEMCRVAMDITTRIRIDYKTGTVEERALFTEEAVPSESIFYSLLLINVPLKKSSDIKESKDVENMVRDLLEKCSLVQFGGDASVGRGLVRIAAKGKEG